jgi:hypothetical protein
VDGAFLNPFDGLRLDEQYRSSTGKARSMDVTLFNGFGRLHPSVHRRPPKMTETSIYGRVPLSPPHMLYKKDVCDFSVVRWTDCRMSTLLLAKHTSIDSQKPVDGGGRPVDGRWAAGAPPASTPLPSHARRGTRFAHRGTHAVNTLARETPRCVVILPFGRSVSSAFLLFNDFTHLETKQTSRFALRGAPFLKK